MNAHELAQATAIAVAISHPDHAGIIFSTARVEDFDPPFRQIAEAIHKMRLSKTPIDTLTVVDELTRRGTIGRVGGSAAVYELMQYGYGGTPAADHAVQIIANHNHRRSLWKTGGQLMQAAEMDETDPLRLAKSAIREAQGVVDRIDASGDDVLTPSLREFLDTEDAPYDWVLPGLLERGDRLVLTGTEGAGKSELMRQLAICAAAGVHPFTGARQPVRRVLLVDCENGVPKLRRAMRGLAAAARRYGADPAESLWVEARPQGLDLETSEDEAWLVRHVSTLQPDLLLTGPIYRLHAGNPNDEEPARNVARVLDRCREAANCALAVEAHAGHGMAGATRAVRPTGSSLWLRWPEFGYGIRPTENHTKEYREVDFVPWRGDREARDWPSTLAGGGVWPWHAVDAGLRAVAG